MAYRGIGKTWGGESYRIDCWNDDLNADLIDACKQGGDLCAPEVVAELLNLPFCNEDGEPCPAPSAPIVAGIIGVVAGAGVVLMAKRLRRAR